MEKKEIKEMIRKSLEAQGFKIQGKKILLPENLNKDKLRQIHRDAVNYKIERAKARLKNKESYLLRKIANGEEVDPSKIFPRLIEVSPKSDEELLFRYISLHWSIPVSSGYGRRIRFLVEDQYNGKIIGIFGLGDPVFSLKARDNWVGWDKETRRFRLRHVMDAFVLGAVPPYSYLLCGKLVAMLVACNEVRIAFQKKYGGKKSIISEKPFDGRLAMITTVSALGRSSIYNRIKYKNHLLFRSVGFTRGFGEFHFANGVYNEIYDFVLKNCTPTAKQKSWGQGFRNRREVIRKCLREVGLSADWLNHGIEREVFVIPLARNTREFLRGEENQLNYYQYSLKELFDYFRNRWLLPRVERDKRYKEFKASSYVLFKGKENENV